MTVRPEFSLRLEAWPLGGPEVMMPTMVYRSSTLANHSGIPGPGPGPGPVGLAFLVRGVPVTPCAFSIEVNLARPFGLDGPNTS